MTDNEMLQGILLGGAIVVSAMFTVTVAAMKNRNWVAWYLAGAAVPIVAVLYLLALPALDDEGAPVR